MEYFLGSALTMLAMFITTRLILPRTLKTKVNNIKYSQSHIHTLVMPLLPDLKTYRKKMPTQSSKHDEKVNIRVVILDNKAYFVKDGGFYCADVDGDSIDKQSATVVDTMGMDKVQLDKMLFIMDQLRDGKKNDSGDSRNQ